MAEPAAATAGTTTATATSPSNDTTPARVVPAPPPPPPAHPTIVDPSIHDRLLRDYRRLKSRLDVLEKENEGLRASLWELSWRYGRSNGKGKARKLQPDEDEDEDEQLDEQPHDESVDAAPSPEPLKLAIPPHPTPQLDLTPTPTPRTFRGPPSSVAGSRPSTPPSASGATFMRLNEPLTTSHPTLPTTTALPITPSSLAASLFPAKPAPRPSSPSSTSSRTTPALRDATLKRDLDITLPTARQRDIEERQSWRWGRGYDLKGHRGAIYAMKFSERELPGRGRLLATAGFDGVRVWGPKADGGERTETTKAEGDEREDEEDEDGDAWDDGDVDEVVHLSAHAAPVSDVAFSSDMKHIVSGGYDSQVCVVPLNAPAATGAAPFAPVWSTATDGLVQSVAWVNSPETAADSGNLFAWGTSGKVLAIGDLRMEKPAMTVATDAMINSIQSFRRSPHLLVGDSAGQVRHFSIRTGSFVAPAEAAAAAMMPPPPVSAPVPGSAATKKATPISCLAVNGDWRGKREARWVASIGFDNFIRVFDRGTDPLKSSPKLVQTLKGKNRNWPIKAAWYQGRDYLDSTPASQRRTAASRTRSRSGSFTNERSRSFPPPHDSDSDSDSPPSSRLRPLSSSLLLAAGSADPVVLLYDLSRPAPGAGGASSTDGAALVQRLEGHKDSVYAVDFLEVGQAGEEGAYRGHGLLASGGADCVVKVWKPIFAEVE